MSLRSPLGHARGLGSAKTGAHHFWMQRLSAVALVPLTLWFVFSVAQLSGASYTGVLHWVREPVSAVALVLFLTALLYHSMLGVQVVIEDYVHHEGVKLTSLVLSKFAHLTVAAASIFAVLKVALG
ncbi:MAG: succinate dehydrogenase, hydrophobic membrane anchor protein [Pseudomonadota bacterium]